MICNRYSSTYWDGVEPTNECPHNEYIISMGVVMALGKERGDYSALSVVAKHKETGIIYIADSFGERIKVDEYNEVIVEKDVEWQPDVIAVESVEAQEIFADTLKYELANAVFA